MDKGTESKSNRDILEMSDLTKVNVPDGNLPLTSQNVDKNDTEGEHEADRIKEDKAQVVFTGLNSLTTINHSPPSELSDLRPVVQDDYFGQESIGSAESPVWVSPYLAAGTEEVESPYSSSLKETDAGKMQDEIDQLKTNCLTMDKDSETFKCNSDVPEMSDLMKVNVPDGNLPLTSQNVDKNDTEGEHEADRMKEDKAEGFFTGLNSLTTINHSPPSELFDLCSVVQDEAFGQQCIGSAESPVWVSPYLAASTEEVESPYSSSLKETDAGKMQPNETNEAGALPQIDDQMAKLESEDDLYAVDNNFKGNNSVTAQDIGTALDFLARNAEWDLYPGDNNFKENNFVTECDMDTLLEIPGRNSEEDVEVTNVTDISTLKHETSPADPEKFPSESMACGNTASMMTEWTSSEISMPARKLPLSDIHSPVSSSASSTVWVENVSQPIELMQYAMREVQCYSRTAEATMKGYAEIPSLLGFQYVRRISGDNYCAVRSAIFQVLAQGIPLPNWTEAFHYLSQALNNKEYKWLKNWKFPGRIRYDRNHLMVGFQVCLQHLHNVASVLSTITDNKEDTLVALLNSEPVTDLHIMEAVKLHMLYHAMQLHETYLSGQEVPLFAVLMFARDTSKTPKDFMNNHLCEVGIRGGLEQVEMCLLGEALGVTIKVVRPCAYGTDGFICSYPDHNEGNLPEIFLIAEEDLHYNVLVN